MTTGICISVLLSLAGQTPSAPPATAPAPAFTPPPAAAATAAVPAAKPAAPVAAAPAAKPAVAPAAAPAAAPAVLPAKPGTDGHNIPAGAVPGPVHPANTPLKFDTTSHDFGKIGDSHPVSFDFKFKNTTDKVINILNATGSCGCTVPSWEKQIQPGAESKITTTFNPAGRNGREVKTVTLYLDDVNTPQLQLQIAADVQRRVIVEPMQVYMGEVNFRSSRDQILTVTGRAENFDITSSQIPGNGFQIAMTGRDKVDVNGEMLNRITFKISSDENLPIGRVQANAMLATNDPASPSVHVALIADIAGQLRLSPPQMGVKMTGPNEPFVADAFLENREARPFSILGVTFEPGAGLPQGTDLKAIVDVTRRDPASKAAYRIRLAGTTPANATELRGSIKIQTDVKDQEEIVIPVSGYQMAPMPNMAKPSPAIAPNPSITKAPEKQLPPAGGSIPAGRPAAGDESKPAGPAQTAPGIKK